jgi:threonyl-tRNA synthetase
LKRRCAIVARDRPFTKEVWSREKTKQVFREGGENWHESWSTRSGNEPIKIYQGDWSDPCRGLHGDVDWQGRRVR